MPSDHNHRDRKEAARLLLATALAILLLIVIGGAGLYYILGMGQSDPFSARALLSSLSACLSS